MLQLEVDTRSAKIRGFYELELHRCSESVPMHRDVRRLSWMIGALNSWEVVRVALMLRRARSTQRSIEATG